MARKQHVPQGVVLSNVPCAGPHTMKANIRRCPEENILKQKIVDSGGDRCFKCFQHDNPFMNSGKDHGGEYKGGSGLPGSKGGPPKKGSGKKAKSA